MRKVSRRGFVKGAAGLFLASVPMVEPVQRFFALDHTMMGSAQSILPVGETFRSGHVSVPHFRVLVAPIQSKYKLSGFDYINSFGPFHYEPGYRILKSHVDEGGITVIDDARLSCVAMVFDETPGSPSTP